LKLGVVPADAKVKWTADGTDPANNGVAYPAKGVDVKEGATVKVYAEKASTHAEIAISVPKEDEEGGGKGKPGPTLDPNKPATLAGKALQEMALVSRMNVHGFLSKLPKDATLVGPRAKVVKAETDNHVAVAWDGKTRVTADRLLNAYKFLDGELPDAEWDLQSVNAVIFSTGKALIEWQKDLSLKIAPGLITQ
jgi:hypothetical protein